MILLLTPVIFKLGERKMILVNKHRVARVAERIRNLPAAQTAPLTFTGPLYPDPGQPGVLEYFFATTMQNYGFWIGDERGYIRPLDGVVGDKKLKGSDLMWTLSKRVYDEVGPQFFFPDQLYSMDPNAFDAWLPRKYDFQERSKRYFMAVEFGKHCLACSVDCQTILDVCNKSTQPLGSFIRLTSRMPGYDRDRLLKKNALLAMILANRPEKFLKPGTDEEWPVIVDYHLMRVALRLGLVEATEPDEQSVLTGRKWAWPELEEKVRFATYDAVQTLVSLSGRTMSEVDFLLWSARRYCPEMEEPKCSQCVLADDCEKKTRYFQPVFRTTNY